MPTTTYPFPMSYTTCSGQVTSIGSARIDTSVSRSLTVKRVRPKGTAALFAPTALSYQLQTAYDRGVKASYQISCLGKTKSGFWTSSLYQAAGFGRPTTVELPSPSVNLILEKIKNQKVNLAMMLAEYKQTAAMFTQCARGLFDIYRGIKSGKLLYLLAKGVRSSPNTWLLYRYGITPLYYDMKGSLELLASTDKPLINKVIAREKMTKVTNSIYKWTPPAATQAIKLNKSREETSSVKYLAYLEYDKPNLAYLAQVGLTNPIELGWELIPFSFVVDWFIDIGGSLAAIDALTGVGRISCVKISRSEVNESWPQGSRGTGKYYHRAVIGLSSPSLPTWDPSLTRNRILDSLALLRGIVRK